MSNRTITSLAMGGASSKAEFVSALSQLHRRDLTAADMDVWDSLWKTSLDAEGIFEIVSPTDVRKLISNRPGNVKVLFSQAVAQLFQVVETPYPVYFEQAMTCTRVLARVLPFMLESDNSEIRDLCWKPRQLDHDDELDGEDGEDQSSVANNEGEQKEDTKTAGEANVSAPNDMDDRDADEAREAEPLAVVLVNSVFHLLFLPDFTIEDPQQDFKEEDLITHRFKSSLMWAPGVGSPEKSVTGSSQFDKTRCDVLRLMVALFSDSLYQRPEAYDSCRSPWMEIATSVDVPYGEVVFSSLINVVLGYDPIGWGVPYGGVFSTDTAMEVMELAAQTLIILLDYGFPCKTVDTPSTDETVASSTNQLPHVEQRDYQAPGFNVFRKYLSRIESHDELNFIFRGFARLLNNCHESQSTVLPYSITQVKIEQELLILLWKCLEENPNFMPFILKHCDVTQILVPICYFLLESRKDPAKLGLMYLCTFTLLKISGERNFGVALNKAYFLRLPVDVPLFSGTHADLLMVTLHKLIVSGIDRLSALYNCFLTIICNISPYTKTMSSVSSVKLVNLFQLFTSPRFLYAAEGNHIYVSLLLETFNNVIQYQYEGNANLVYAIVKRKELFDVLANLTLHKAIETAVKHSPQPSPTKKATSTIEAAVASGGGGKIDTETDKSGKGKKEKEVEVAPEGEAKASHLITTQEVERSISPDGGEVEKRKEESAEVNGDHSNDEGTTSLSSVPSATSTVSTPPVTNANVRFMPTRAWLDSVKGELPLTTIMRLLKYLSPQLQEKANETVDESVLVNFVQNTTLVGLLPVPHPIVIRKYQPNKYTSLWFSAFLWGVVFMHNQDIPLFDGKNIKLFIVQNAR